MRTDSDESILVLEAEGPGPNPDSAISHPCDLRRVIYLLEPPTVLRGPSEAMPCRA